MAWAYLSIAGGFEIIFAVLLKLSDGFSKPVYVLGVFVAAAISLFFLTRAMQQLPIGTAYSVWTGFGAFGAVLVGIIYFGESIHITRLLFLALLIASIIGLKFTSGST